MRILEEILGEPRQGRKQRIVNSNSARQAILSVALLAIAANAVAQDLGDGKVDENLETTETTTAAESTIAEPESAAPPMATRDDIDAAYSRFMRLRSEGRSEDATTAALQVAELTQQVYGPESEELATPLINLAIMQSHNGDLTAAEQNYRAAITLIERHEGMLSPRLINPLSGLGHTYNRAGNYEQAIESFDRALRLNNIELGFTNFEQFGIQDGLTESYIGTGDYDDASFYQEAQLEIYQRKYGRDNPRVVPGMYKLAEWYSRVGNLEQSALIFRSADRILRESEGEISVARADALMGLARLYERQGNRPAAATTLRKGIKLLDENPETDPLRRAQLQVALGDLYTREGRPTSAEVAYTEAWRDLSANEEYLDERDDYFRMPVRLSGGPFPNNARNPRRIAGPTRVGSVVIRYDVDADGRASNVTVVESEPPGLMEDGIKSVYRRSAYRPRFVDGEPIDTTDLLSRHEFSYVAAAKADDRGELQQPEVDRGRLERPGD